MSITLSYDTLCKLSINCREEILSALRDSWSYPTKESTEDDLSVISTKEKFDVTVLNNSPFDSAALSFSSPLILPNSRANTKPSNGPCQHILALAGCTCVKQTKNPIKQIRYAAKTPVALFTDLYTAKTQSEIDEITKDIDSGYFIGKDSWLTGKKHHPMNFDVRKVLNIITECGPINSYNINMKLTRMCRNRISAILRQLKIQGIISAKPKV
jgi:hypothetical protein